MNASGDVELFWTPMPSATRTIVVSQRKARRGLIQPLALDVTIGAPVLVTNDFP